MNFSPDPFIIQQIETILDQNNIPHGRLVAFTRSNNDALTDSSKSLFIKISLIDNKISLTRELEFVKNYGNIIPTFPLLYDQLIHLTTSEGESRYATIWKFQPSIRPIKNLNSNIINQLVTQLKQIHALPKHDFVEPYDINWLFNAIERRTRYAETHFNKTDQNIQLLRTLAETLITKDRFNWTTAVVNHGDCHLGNAGYINGKYQWYDYESSIYLPREWDIAVLSSSLRRYRDRYDLWEQAVEQFETVGPVNMEYVEFFETLKALSYSSFMLLHPEMLDTFDKRMQLMKGMLDGGSFPAHLPAKLPDNANKRIKP